MSTSEVLLADKANAIFTRTNSKVGEGSLKKTDSSVCSVSLIVDLLPGILTTLACLISVIVLNVMQQHYLSIAAGAGTITGAFTIYQGYQANLLATFQENNLRLKASVEELGQQNDVLKANNLEFQDENQKLSASITGLQTSVKGVKKENQTLAASNEDLKNNINDLQKTNAALEDTANAHLARLEALKESLNGIQHATEKDHNMFSQHVEVFIAEVKKIQEVSAQFEKGSSFEKTILLLHQTAAMLQEIFVKINEWKDDQHVAQQIEMQQALERSIAELEQQNALQEKLNREEAKEIEKLHKVKDEFRELVDIFVSQTQKVVKRKTSDHEP